MATTTPSQTNVSERMSFIETMRHWNLSTKLLVIILVAVLIPQLVAALISFPVAREQAITNVGQNVMKVRSDSAGRSIAQYLQGHISLLSELTLNDAMLQDLEEHNAAYQGSDDAIVSELLAKDAIWRGGDTTTPLVAQTLSQDETVNPTSEFLAAFQRLAPENIAVSITDSKGAVVGTTGMMSGYYQGNETWWREAYGDGRTGGVFIGSPEIDEASGITTFAIAIPVQANGEVAGVIRTALDFESVLTLLADLHFGENGRMMLFAADGTLLADPEGQSDDGISPADAIAISQADSAVLQGDSQLGVNTLYSSSPVSESGEGMFAHSDSLEAAGTDIGWFVVAREPVSEAVSDLVRSNIISLLITIGAALIGVLLARWMLRPTLNQVAKMRPVIEAVREGDYSARSEVITGDELGEMASSFNTMLDETTVLIQGEEERNRIQASIMNLLVEVSAVADGDLTVEATVNEDMTGAIADSLNFMTENLNDVLSQVQQTALTVNSAANEIQASAEQLAHGSELQATQIVDTSAAIDEMAVSIQQVSENSTLSATVGEQARVNAQRGGEAVRDTIDGMNRIRTQVQNTSKRIKRLGEGTQEIDEMLQLIRTITKRTSILALNASIQASRAGEAGRSFMVVAEEVEQLAERSADAAKQIEGLVHNIQVETNEAVASMEATTHEVVIGSQLANEAGNRLTEIETVSERLSELIQGISRASQQQARGSESIAKSMNEIADVTKQTTTGTRDTTVSIRSLAQQAEELREAVSSFKLNKTAA